MPKKITKYDGVPDADLVRIYKELNETCDKLRDRFMTKIQSEEINSDTMLNTIIAYNIVVAINRKKLDKEFCEITRAKKVCALNDIEDLIHSYTKYNID